MASTLLTPAFDFKGPQTQIVQSEPTIDGLKFESEGHGLHLALILPKTVSPDKKLEIKITLKNTTSGDRRWYSWTDGSRGLYLKIIGSNGEELELTALGKRMKELREGTIGMYQSKLHPGETIVTTIVVEDLYKASPSGIARLIVEWHDLKIGNVGMEEDPNKALRVEGTVQIEKAANGLSISRSG